MLYWDKNLTVINKNKCVVDKAHKAVDVIKGNGVKRFIHNML